MKLKNLQRASELQEDYVALKKAREILSEDGALIGVAGDNDSVTLPPYMRYNMLQIVNLEINKIEKEVNEL